MRYRTVIWVLLLLAPLISGCGLFSDGQEPVLTEGPAHESRANSLPATPSPVVQSGSLPATPSPVAQSGSLPATASPVAQSDSLPTTPSPAAQSGSAAPVGYDGPMSLEERIFASPVIVRVRFKSVSSTVESGPAPDGTTKYVSLLEFSFTVLDYLKGSGPSSIVAVWQSSPVFDTREEAEAALPAIVAARDTRWDDREAIVFLEHSVSYLSSTQQTGRFFLAWQNGIPPYEDRYSLANRLQKMWLPTETASGASNQSSGDQQRFLLDVPPSTGEAPTITLGEVKDRIAAVVAKLNAGDGSPEYTECVRRTYWRERLQSYREETFPDRTFIPSPSPPQEHSLVSGLSKASTLYEDDQGYGIAPNSRNQFWLDGGDADLFSVTFGEAVPYDSTGDGVNDGINFTRSVVTSRPIPEGVYKFHSNDRGSFFIPCDGFVLRYEWTVTVAAPDGVLHELFFDPVSVGLTVAADDTNGVLKPATFTDANGGSATIHSISYEVGTVEVEVTPDGALAGEVLDIIELDGTVSLSLDVADATVDAANDTLSWSVASRPWEGGDMLMVRIREAR